MAKQRVVNAQIRESNGSGNSRRLRREGKTPGVMYGGGGTPLSLILDHDALFHQLEDESFFSSILTIKTEKGTAKAIVRDVQIHPFKPIIFHVDFLRVNAKEAITIEIPVHLIGAEDAPGVEEGGIVSTLMSEIEISCLPGDLPEYLDVDVSHLNIGESVHLSEVILPEGVTIPAFENAKAEAESHEEEGDEEDFSYDYTVVTVLAPVLEVEEDEEDEDEETEGEEGTDEDDEKSGEDETEEKS